MILRAIRRWWNPAKFAELDRLRAQIEANWLEMDRRDLELARRAREYADAAIAERHGLNPRELN